MRGTHSDGPQNPIHDLVPLGLPMSYRDKVAESLVVHYRPTKGHDYQFPWAIAPLIFICILAESERVEHSVDYSGVFYWPLVPYRLIGCSFSGHGI